MRPAFIATVLIISLGFHLAAAQAPADAIVIEFEGEFASHIADGPGSIFWSPDSRSITLLTYGNNARVWLRYDLSGGTLTKMDGDPRQTTLSVEEMTHYRAAEPTAWVSSDGSHIFYRMTYETYETYGPGGSFSSMYAIGDYDASAQGSVQLGFRPVPHYGEPIEWSSSGDALYLGSENCCGITLRYIPTGTPHETVFVDSLAVANGCIRRDTILDMTPDGGAILYLSDRFDSNDCHVTLWRATEITFPTGTFIIPQRREFVLERPAGAAFIANDPGAILVADTDGFSRLSLETGENVVLRGSADIAGAIGVVFSPDSRHALVYSGEGSLFILPLLPRK